MKFSVRRLLWAAVPAVLAAGCATLGQLAALVRPPNIQADRERQAELRLFAPSDSRRYGGAGVRLWARVENPNPFGVTLSTLAGQLYLEGTEAAEVDLPLGLPLVAQQETIVPIDLSLSFENIPRLGEVVLRAATGSPLEYRLEGTIGVDAGQLGQPTFGPLTLLQGDVRVRR
jgi:hypothetical protein